MTQYIDGPADQEWVVIPDEGDDLTYVQRSRRDERPYNPYEVVYTFDGSETHDLPTYLAAQLNRLDALAAWSCDGCGARFEKPSPRELLVGVTHCSSCVEADMLAKRIALLEARLGALCGAVEVCRDDDDLEWLDVFDSNVAALLSAKQAAREVLG